jgi:hypothetical protein
MAAVAHVLDDEQQQADCYHAQVCVGLLAREHPEGVAAGAAQMETRATAGRHPHSRTPALTRLPAGARAAASSHPPRNNTQQKDAQYLCMVLPSHPLGYSMFARCAMNGQAMPLAAAFLQRGLAAARAAGADSSVTAMAFQRAAALLLGGGGPKVDAAEVQALLQEGEDARNGVLVWWPEPWQVGCVDAGVVAAACCA